MSSFALSQLKKFGWKEGEGLGKRKQGIKKYIKVAQKQDLLGIGSSDDHCFAWWDHCYNETASKLVVTNNHKGNIEIIKENYKAEDRKQSIDSDYFCKNFVSVSKVNERTDYSSKFTDAEIFEACGRRTAFKGARGIHRNAKRTASPSKIPVKSLKKKKSTKKKTTRKRSK
ncbi:G patch domain-containing protein 4-like [Zophobas morio]|uniref:G patch domain-containing protein 4-like n=1 Tax=Zophobas morio TaxID=2755281 RepID=UPI00308360D6